jgi:GDPmannose 4,6-dehydratase
MKYGLQEKLFLGNLEAKRDWGYAGDYVEAMWLMLQQDQPQDYVIATGESHSVREFVNLAFQHAGIEIEWQGSALSEKGVVASIDKPAAYSLLPTAYSGGASQPKVGDVIVSIDPRYFRPTEVEFLLGDASKAKKNLGWEPKIRFQELVRMMVDADIKELEEMRRCQDVIRKLKSNH